LPSKEPKDAYPKLIIVFAPENMEYKVAIDSFSTMEWEKCACDFADYSIYQTWPYQQVRADRVHQQISRFIVKDDTGQVVTMGQIRIRHIKSLGLKIGYVQWGPLVRGKDRIIKCSAQALKALDQAYTGSKVNILRFVPNICEDGKHEVIEMLRTAGFQHIQTFTPYRTLMLNTEDSEDGIRKRLRKSFRRDLKKAEKSRIAICEGHDNEQCKILNDLYLASLKRKGFKGLDVWQFIEPQRMLSCAEKMNIIVAYCQGEPASVLLMSNLGDTAIVLLAASSEKGLVCGSSYLVWYRGALSALNAGMKRYDLGGIDPDNNPNVYQFKSRMGGEEAFHIGAFEACSSLRAKVSWRMAEKVYNWIRK
jgi:lipid II:glycine glycyltransferase (peptidoglycan interpeptide bridge formation enzyme)